MLHKNRLQRNDEGFILVAALMILMVLTLIGIMAGRDTTTELRIAGNDRTYKETFYGADGGVNFGSELLEQNIACLDAKNGFSAKNDFVNSTLNGGALIDGLVYVKPTALDFADKFAPAPIPNDSTDRMLFYPYNYTGTETHTNINIGGNTKMTTGAAIQMAAGYEGKGKGIGGGGSYLAYDVNAQHLGENGSETVICVKYRHIINTAPGVCSY